VTETQPPILVNKLNTENRDITHTQTQEFDKIERMDSGSQEKELENNYNENNEIINENKYENFSDRNFSQSDNENIDQGNTQEQEMAKTIFTKVNLFIINAMNIT